MLVATVWKLTEDKENKTVVENKAHIERKTITITRIEKEIAYGGERNAVAEFCMIVLIYILYLATTEHNSYPHNTHFFFSRCYTKKLEKSLLSTDRKSCWKFTVLLLGWWIFLWEAIKRIWNNRRDESRCRYFFWVVSQPFYSFLLSHCTQPLSVFPYDFFF